ncbi:S41 family peptidase [Lactobacillus sp. CC-MHH1034]|uniref:S41 family peptidase n=1 Tax=Agrilactobacillus fermenti TaxID=2586909 RepID=UPI001E37DBF8|nr:S41 family peptidase [Agrilactobacillus fermenti]MCD2256552.1 S41 family peptidase [Agrilactobacillus fermenti]
MADEPKQNNQKKQKKTVSRFVPIFVGILAFLIGVFLTIIVGFFLISRTLMAPTGQNSSGFNKISTVYQTIKQNYYRPVNSEKLIDGAVNGMVQSLGDQFSEYLPKEDASDLNTTISASFGGIGASVKQSGNYVAVDAPVKDTPAKKAGLKTGDIILAIDGQSAKNLGVSKVVSKIRGKIGTKVKLTLKRDDRQFDVTLTRAKIPVKTVSGKLDSDNKQIGNIQISTFSEPTAKELKQTIKKLRTQGAKSFVIDLRGNPGGTLPTALASASMFLKNGQTIMQVQQRDSKPERFTAGKTYDDGFKVTEPTVVLVDEDSASASEIFASALKESAGDQIIGTTSFGKGTVQTVSDLGHDSEMKITTARWLTPDGHWINKKGVQPTIVAKYPDYAYLSTFDVEKTYKSGDSSRTIITIQKSLQALGYPLDQTNGVYDQSTLDAVKQFQNDYQIPVSGEMDPTTNRRLTEALSQLIGKNDNAYKQAIATLTAKLK